MALALVKERGAMTCDKFGLEFPREGERGATFYYLEEDILSEFPR